MRRQCILDVEVVKRRRRGKDRTEGAKIGKKTRALAVFI